MIIVGAPHTSNWDFVLFLATLRHYGMKVRFLGKHTLFRPPFGWFFERLGGIPVDRSKTTGIVGQVAQAFDAAAQMILVIAPEGTRKAAPSWKSGFLAMAEESNVPVVLAGVDYPRRTVSLSEAIDVDGDVAAFMDIARDFYRGKRGLHPDLETPVAVEEELERS